VLVTQVTSIKNPTYISLVDVGLLNQCSPRGWLRYVTAILSTKQDGAYNFPNDERENDRLDFQHHQFLLTFSSKLFTAPIPPKKALANVLDVGTGTGIWAIDFADEHPESKVVGVDLSPIQPSFLPPNLTFQIDDLEEPWTFAEKFDLIYSRMMIGSFANVPKFVEQSFEFLAPGGFLEMADITYPVRLNDGKFPEDSALEKWYV
jgi:SAM-dependent methyltransferase